MFTKNFEKVYHVLRVGDEATRGFWRACDLVTTFNQTGPNSKLLPPKSRCEVI